MAEMDEMPDHWARKFHEDRRQHGEVSAVTMTNSEKFRKNHARIAWGGPGKSELELLDELKRITDPEPNETRQYASNFDDVFGDE